MEKNKKAKKKRKQIKRIRVMIKKKGLGDKYKVGLVVEIVKKK